jgi:hypothetical protein
MGSMPPNRGIRPKRGQEVVMKRRMARMRDWLTELDFIGAILALLIGAGRLEPKPIPVRVRRR